MVVRESEHLIVALGVGELLRRDPAERRRCLVADRAVGDRSRTLNLGCCSRNVVR